MKCPHCGHTPATKRPKPTPVVDVDLSVMPESDRRAYYTRTAPFFDIQFMIDNGRGLSAALLSDARELARTVDAAGRFSAGMTRAIFYRQYAALSARRRGEREAQSWRDGILTDKARAWSRALEPDAATIGTLIQLAMVRRFGCEAIAA